MNYRFYGLPAEPFFQSYIQALALVWDLPIWQFACCCRVERSWIESFTNLDAVILKA
jgi:hypothetical protein